MTRFIAAVIAFCTLAGAQAERPEREVHGNVITSKRSPAVRIELPPGTSYVGGDRWVLYGVADCEVHVFVEADRQKIVRQLYWVQFEGYIPSRPELQYKYPFSRTLKLGGVDFDVRARFGSGDQPPGPGSDLERVRALIQARGYRLPKQMMNVRLVHLPDENRREELMIIYAEDLAPTGFTVADLLPGGRAEKEWPAIESRLIERAKARLNLRFVTKR